MRKLLLISFLFLHFDKYILAQLYVPNFTNEVICSPKLTDGVKDFSYYHKQLYSNPFVYQNTSAKAVHFVFLLKEGLGDTLDSKDHLCKLLGSELVKKEDSEQSIIRKLEFETTWSFQLIPDQFIIRDFKSQTGDGSSYYAGHHTIWIVSEDSINLTVVERRIKEGKQLNIHEVKRYTYVKDNKEMFILAMQKKEGVGCLIDETDALIKQVMNVFNYKEIKENEKKKEIEYQTKEDVSSKGDNASKVDNNGAVSETKQNGYLFRYSRFGLFGLSGSSLHASKLNALNGRWALMMGIQLGRGNFEYVELTNYWMKNVGKKNITYQDVTEHGWIEFSQVGFDFSLRPLNKTLSSKREIECSWSIDFTLGGMSIDKASYYWSTGTKSVRGYLPGISDELINIPDLGFVENVSVAGQRGDLAISKFSGYLQFGTHFIIENNRAMLFGGLFYTKSTWKKSGNGSPDAESVGLGGVASNIVMQKICLQMGMGIKLTR